MEFLSLGAPNSSHKMYISVRPWVKGAKSVAFIGTGVIAEAMARATATVYGFEAGFAYSRDMSKSGAFADKMSAELGYAFTACKVGRCKVGAG